MSDKFTKIFAIFALLFLAGIMISAILPDSKQEDLAVPDAVSEVLSSASDTEKAEKSRKNKEKSVRYFVVRKIRKSLNTTEIQ